MARSAASIASLPACAGAKAFQLLISPLRDWRKEMVTCSACCTAWKIASCGSFSRVPMPAAAEGQRWAMWSTLCSCRQIAFTRSIWIS